MKCVGTAAAALISTVAAGAGTNYWWEYPNTDCDYVDLKPQPDCASAADGNVTKLEACCLATATCAGFNTNGYLKLTGCESKKNAVSGCDLYVLHDAPQPPTPPPTPPPPTPRGPQRNILFMLVDDGGFESPVFGNNVSTTPNLVALARKGSVFDHAYNAVSSCSPVSPPHLFQQRPAANTRWRDCAVLTLR